MSLRTSTSTPSASSISTRAPSKAQGGLVQTIDYPFEEAAGFSVGEYRAGLFNGVAEIAYASNGEWFISALSIECDNGKLGDAAHSKMEPLSQAYDGPLFHAIADNLRKFSGGHIDDRVREMLTGGRQSALIAAE